MLPKNEANGVKIIFNEPLKANILKYSTLKLFELLKNGWWWETMMKTAIKLHTYDKVT